MVRRSRLKKQVHVTKTECRYRQASPAKFDPRSFRSKQVSSRTRLIVACPKGEWSSKAKRCKVGMELQSLIRKRTAEGACPKI